MSFKFFYTDYSTDKHIRSDEAVSETIENVIEHMQSMLKEPDNFIGLIDENNLMLQFMVEDDGSILVDVPMHERKGSFTKHADLNESIEIVRSLNDEIVWEEIDGLQFKNW
ncbi:hypothetical protein [Neptuniibacter sp. QD57_21]|uniref:hypothetical protein n=1 Tax=Neptuniibacter sp. QD57_21 TaxID=3398213 RepID=UPI0039F52999